MSDDQSYQATANASGVATVTITISGRTRMWSVSQISTECPSAPIGATCVVRKNGSLVTPLISTGDVAGGDPPLSIRPQDVLTITWTGLTVGTVAAVYIIYDEQKW